MSQRHAGHGGALASQVAQRLRGLIDTGSYTPGETVPSVRRLATDWDISPSTAVHAYQRLLDEGLLVNLPRIGYRVMAKPSDRRIDGHAGGTGKPTLAAVGDRQLSFLMDCERLRCGFLGTAHPDPSLLPREELQSWIRRCLREDPQCGLDYRIGPGDAGLRRQIARRYGLRGRQVPPDEVVITNGCTEALVLALRTLCAPGDVVAVESPTFFNHLRVLEHLRLRVVEIPIDARDGLDPSRLAETLHLHQVRVLLTVPVLHNPLGVGLSAARQRDILAVCGRFGVAVVEDVIYVGLGAATGRPPLFRDHPATIPVMTCGSVSKVLAPGWRIGWVLAGALHDRLIQAKIVCSLGSPELQQRALAGFLSTRADREVLVRAATVYRERLNRGRCLVLQHFPRGTRCSDPEGGMVLWIQLPDGISVDELYRQATAEGLCFAPGDIFGLHVRHATNLRICIARLDAEAQTAIARIGSLATGILRRTAADHGR